MQNNFPPKYNSGIAAKTLSILEILLTLVRGVQPYEILKKKKKKGKREKYIFKFRVKELSNCWSIEQTEVESS